MKKKIKEVKGQFKKVARKENIERMIDVFKLRLQYWGEADDLFFN